MLLQPLNYNIFNDILGNLIYNVNSLVAIPMNNVAYVFLSELLYAD